MSGNRKAHHLHTRFRLKFTQLNQDLFIRTLVDSPLCACGCTEDYMHYFLECPVYRVERETLLMHINNFVNTARISKKKIVDIIIYGRTDLSVQDNANIAEHVQTYIIDTKRF